MTVVIQTQPATWLRTAARNAIAPLKADAIRRRPAPIPQQGALRWTVLLVVSLAVLPAVGFAALAWFTGV